MTGTPTRVRVYDSGPEIGSDRYSVFIGNDTLECLSLSADASSPQGVCQWSEANEEDFAGSRIPLATLPLGAVRALEERIRHMIGDGPRPVKLADDPKGQVTIEAELPVAPAGPRLRPSGLARSQALSRVAPAHERATVVV